MSVENYLTFLCLFFTLLCDCETKLATPFQPIRNLEPVMSWSTKFSAYISLPYLSSHWLIMMNTFVSISLCHRFVVLLLRRSIRHYRVLKQVNIRINYHNCVLCLFIFVHMLCEKHKEKREYARICTCEHFGCLIHARNTCTHAFFFLSPDKVFRPLFFPSCLSQPCDRGQKNLIFFILCFE